LFDSLTLRVTISCTPDMIPTSLVAAVAPRTSKLIRKFATKYYTRIYVNENRFFWKRLDT